MTIDSVALDRVLSAIEVRSGQARRTTLAPGGLLALAPGSMVLGYLLSGEITAAAPGGLACTLDPHTGAATPVSGPRTLLPGDAFLHTDASASALESTSGATLMSAELEVAWPATARALPGFVFVEGFADREPAAAGLVAHLGPGDADRVRSGDPVICRMMIATVVLSFIRAWAAAGCAPENWPAQDADPFLDRVVRAIADEPGRDWTLGALASVGAMSRTVLAERFRAAFGTSPVSFVTETRIQRAKAMLEAGQSVTETSRSLGYSSDEGFSRAFRRHTGVVPSQWRIRHTAAV